MSLVPVDPAAAEPVVRRLGAGDHAAAVASRGWVHTFDREPLLLRRVDPPEASVVTARVVACADGLLEPRTWPALTQAALRRCGAERLQLRSTLPADRLAALGLEVFQHFVAKTARDRPAPPGVALRRPDGDADRRYVAELMCDSLQAAMPGVVFTRQQLDMYVNDYLRLGEHAGAAAAIAAIDGADVGVAVLRVEPDDLTGVPTTLLVDIMTAVRGQRLANRLAPAVEAFVARSPDLPDHLVGTVVGQPGGGEQRIVEELRRDGWRARYTWWSPASG